MANIEFIGWSLFFAVYGLHLYRILVWGARMRVTGHQNGATRIGFFLCASTIGVAPGIAEPLSRAALGLPRLSDVGFSLFIAGWIVATLPGIRASRSKLNEAGINPDVDV